MPVATLLLTIESTRAYILKVTGGTEGYKGYRGLQGDTQGNWGYRGLQGLQGAQMGTKRYTLIIIRVIGFFKAHFPKLSPCNPLCPL